MHKEKPIKLRMIWGDTPIRVQEKAFRTKGEREAYIEGLLDANEWSGYYEYEYPVDDKTGQFEPLDEFTVGWLHYNGRADDILANIEN